MVCVYVCVQKMTRAKNHNNLRCDPPDNYTYHDRVFANRINHLIQLTDQNYAAAMYREALKTGFYDLQVFIALWVSLDIIVGSFTIVC